MADVGMIQRGDGVHFAAETVAEALVRQLDGYLAPIRESRARSADPAERLLCFRRRS
jgi:hypothetical protein